MERSASSSDRPTWGEPLEALTDASRCFLGGSCPSQRAADVACLISSGVRGLVPGEDRARSPSENCHDSSVELTCLALTLVERITSSLPSRSLSPAATRYCVEVLELLFQDMDLMAHLVRAPLGSADDKTQMDLNDTLISQDTISPVWQQKCVQAFYSSAPGPELDACLWSLTEILKRLLKGAHQGKTRYFSLDLSLSALCSKFLPGERKEGTQCLVDLTSSRRWGTASCLLLDLLEVLTASSVIRGAGVCLKSQRITHLHSSALLTSVSCSSQYFVKKRVLLLLKRAVLQKAGEDWALGDVLCTGLRYQHFHADMNTLAQSVLTAVATDWLQSVQVDSASFFGGTRHVKGEEGQKPDCVMLRAVSLLLLKSMELHIQSAGATVGSATEVYGYLQSLWGFLRRCSVQLTEVTHRCCWVSLLFGDQDDDMMEAAKELTELLVSACRLCSGLDDSAVLEAACASGCNPHCHFLLLLQSISFDHSILLDFLISTETCFLEYFVRYLKYLRADWRGFTAACGRISLTGGHRSLQHEKSRFSALDVKQKISGSPMPIGQQQYESSVSKPMCTLERRQEGPSLPVLQSEQTSCPTMWGRLPCETLARAELCMSELREVVTRLQTRKLFPYNPSSLLKLLAQVENCS
uniref:Lines homolog 1 n=1 Tax=Cyclopterus lumpus TaxID=8103 RepID=A0A8C2ZR59_CYCLU